MPLKTCAKNDISDLKVEIKPKRFVYVYNPGLQNRYQFRTRQYGGFQVNDEIKDLQDSEWIDITGTKYIFVPLPISVEVPETNLFVNLRAISRRK